MEFMDECWRVLKVGAKIDIETPYGSSAGFINDPTHCNPINEVTFEYFDPDYERYQWYKPKAVEDREAGMESEWKCECCSREEKRWMSLS